jgi:lipopolysaccharide assembly protein A
MNAKVLLILVLAGLLVLFIIQNVAVVEIQFLFWSVSISRSLLMFIVFGVGVLAGWILTSVLRSEKKKDER